MAGQNMDQFEVFFKRADLDGDGKISGQEAVAFFQGSGLSKQVLSQIWTHADRARMGFLGRAEFYNALKLVTVAQSRRELTPDIVKAALYGPAAAKIPPPKIALPATPANQSNSMAATSVLSMGAVTPPASQDFGFRGPGVPNSSMNQPYFPSQQSQSMRPHQAIPAGRPPLGIAGPGGGMVGQAKVMPPGSAPIPHQVMPAATAGLGALGPNVSNDWLGGRTGGSPTGPGGVRPPMPSVTPQPQNLPSTTSQSTAHDSNVSAVSGNGFASNSFFGGDMFSAATSTTKQGPPMPSHSASSAPASSAIVPISSGDQAQTPAKPRSLDALQGPFAMQPLGSQPPQAPPSSSIGPQHSAQSMPTLPSSGISAATANSSDSSQLPWPKMKPSDVQKYTKVFMGVDDDRDGRITGEQARVLFLSWRLPIEVLKQVWDLSDQDNDSMLSLREFCFALYLMERYKEGRPLPAALPSFRQQQVMGARPITPTSGLRPPLPPNSSLAAGATMSNQQKKGAVLDDSFEDQLANGEQNFTTSKLTDGTAATEKADGRENLILDSKEKIEFYRTKMQELVLYKSRCDNRLNEITERALADKREAELLGKKYEEKYKQVAEIASKLTIEEATFREIQERKMELHQAITKMEKGGSADGILQVRADRIQSDLEELVRVLTERCKKHGLDVKSTAVIELPFGWQPGIQENAAVWDEEWDKFEDEGFANDLTVDVKSISISPKSRSANAQGEKASSDGSLTPNSLSDADGKSGNLFSPGEHAVKSESAYAHSDDESLRSPGRSALESPSQGFSDVFVKSTEADAETHRSFDESWGAAFDSPDDTDSV
ncbi:epidermal growth factor receptor substrate 15-like 1 isoform X1 [Tripterygium wilfordii]|uniref:Epidermal growth factor receptor substrate 15-like 1 isoform X1 n=1 Tax=Tripterygium wilfordii TaxID=458696 RepID=A0A7J7DLS1_TRIWF|nr:epidermal growth factor receptor substrate 15-like 1 isoform X1 [Tripterygium wilfordii]